MNKYRELRNNYFFRARSIFLLKNHLCSRRRAPQCSSKTLFRNSLAFCGSSLIETLIYAAILGMVAIFTTSSLLVMMKSSSSVKLSRDLNFSASTAVERMTNEIRTANSVDNSGSIFATSSGRLKLNTTDSFGAPTAIEFFLSGFGVFVKEGANSPESLTASSTEILSLIFDKINSASTSSAVKISLIIKAKNGSIERTEKFYNTAILRGSY